MRNRVVEPARIHQHFSAVTWKGLRLSALRVLWQRQSIPALVAVLVAGCQAPERHRVFHGEARGMVAESAGRAVDVEALVSTAGETISTVTLEEVVAAVLAGNRDLAVERFEPVIAATIEAMERGEYDPEVFASLEWSEEVVSETNRATAGQFSVEGEEALGEVGIRQRLPSGTTIEAALGSDYSVSNRTPVQSEGRVGFRVTQALLAGRRPAVNLAAIEQAELMAEISRHELRGYTEALVARAERSYWQLVAASEAVRVVAESLALAEQQEREIRRRIELGDLPEQAVAAAGSEVARREQALIDAESALGARRLAMLRLLGRAGDAVAGLQPGSKAEGIEPQALTNARDRMRLGLRSRAELAEAQLRLRERRLETVVTEDGLRPKLDFFVELGRSGFADQTTRAFEAIGDLETYDVTVGLELSRTLSQRAARGRDAAARAEAEQAEAAVLNLAEQIVLEVRLAINEVERSRRQIAASATTRQLAAQTLEAERLRLGAGAGTTLQVAQAQRDLMAAQLAEVEAKVAYRLALTQLYLAEGSLLDRRGIVLE